MFRLMTTVFLLFGTAACPLAASAAGCSIPDSYTHRTTTIWKSFLVTLATDRPAYSIGDSVHFWLSFENVGTVTDTIPNPNSISPMETFAVVPASCDSVYETECAWFYLFPLIVHDFGLPVILGPGQCAPYEHTWNGIDYFGNAMTAGAYKLIAGMVSANLHFHAPPGGMKLSIQLESPVLARGITWGSIKARYD